MTHSRHIILTCVDRSLAEAGDKLMKAIEADGFEIAEEIFFSGTPMKILPVE